MFGLSSANGVLARFQPARRKREGQSPRLCSRALAFDELPRSGRGRAQRSVCDERSHANVTSLFRPRNSVPRPFPHTPRAMTQMTATAETFDAGTPAPAPAPVRPKLDGGFNARTALIFFSVLALGLFFVAYSLYVDVTESGVRTTSLMPFLLLGVALFIALGFEFVNGFLDTANAVATVIYTHSLPAPVAVVWSGVFNFLG